jgi:hypothetical protein
MQKVCGKGKTEAQHLEWIDFNLKELQPRDKAAMTSPWFTKANECALYSACTRKSISDYAKLHRRAT